jgi:magnesium-transporting ATPase (P-type)
MLTGESIPVMKSSLASRGKYDPNTEFKQNTLFAGTFCIEARRVKAKPDRFAPPVLAVAT